jgi:hypothetical protein
MRTIYNLSICIAITLYSIFALYNQLIKPLDTLPVLDPISKKDNFIPTKLPQHNWEQRYKSKKQKNSVAPPKKNFHKRNFTV